MVKLINNMKHFTKIMLIALIFSIAMIVLVVTTVLALNKQKSILSDLINTRFMIYDRVNKIIDSVQYIELDFQELLKKASNGTDYNTSVKFIEKVKLNIDSYLKDIDFLINEKNVSPKEKEYLEKIVTVLSAQRALFVGVIAVNAVGGGRSLESSKDWINRVSVETKQIMDQTVPDLMAYETEQIAVTKLSSFNSIDNQNTTIFVFCVSAILISIIVSFIISQMIVTPLKKVVDYSKTLSNKDLRALCSVQSKDEIGELALQFNNMVINLKNIIKTIKESQNKNESLKNILAVGTEETLASTTQITTNLDSSSKMISKLDSIVEDMVKFANDISKVVDTYKSQLDEQTVYVEQFSAQFNDMSNFIKKVSDRSTENIAKSKHLLNVTEQGKEKMDFTSDLINQMTNVTSSIKELANYIESIATETKVLSLNAAIEATHAGKFGTGFKVIADEIQKLAEATAESSKSVISNLKESATSINDLLSANKETTTYFNEIRSGVDNTINVFDETIKGVENINSKMQEILVGIKYLNDNAKKTQEDTNLIKTKVDKIKSMTGEVNGVTVEVSNSIAEIASGAKQINEAMTEINTTSITLGQSMEETSNQINSFILE